MVKNMERPLAGEISGRYESERIVASKGCGPNAHRSWSVFNGMISSMRGKLSHLGVD